jgi:hypothetical protein
MDHLTRSFLFCMAALLLGGCVPVESGTLEVGWSLDGKATEARCDEYDAETITITVTDSSDTVFATKDFACTEFSGTIEDITVGDYEVEAQLFDDGGDAVSDTRGPKDVTIAADETESIVFAFDDDDLEGDGTGKLRVEWSIDGSDDSDICSVYDVSHIEIALFDEDGDSYDDPVVVACSAFETTIEDLPTGEYSVMADLLGASGNAVTEALGPMTVKVVSDETVVEEINFSLDHFYH